MTQQSTVEQHPPIHRAGYQSFTAITHHELFTVMGERLHFQTNSRRLLQAAQSAFGCFPQNPATADPHPPLIIQLFVSDNGSASPAHTTSYPPTTWHTRGHLIHLSVGTENTLIADLKEGFAFGYISSSMAQDTTFVRYTFIEMAAQAMLGLARNFVPVHGACVLKENIPLLLHGRSGIGKSTLTYACLQHGYQMLAEDVVQVKMSPTQLRLWGLPWDLHLLPDATRFFPELAGTQPLEQFNGEWKIPVHLPDQFPEMAVTNAPAGPVILLDRSETKKGVIEKASLAEAINAFEVIWTWEQGWQPWFDTCFHNWLAQGTYRLYLDDTPAASVAALDTLIASLSGERNNR